MIEKREITGFFVALAACFCIAADATAQGGPEVFKGRLFPPNLILENREALGLTKAQFTEIRSVVVDVQADIAEFEWDMREAYLKILEELDDSPIDEAQVLAHANDALLAENEVKKRQMAMLVRLRKLLTEEQVEYLVSITGKPPGPGR